MPAFVRTGRCRPRERKFDGLKIVTDLFQQFLGRFFAEPLHVHLGEFAAGARLVDGRVNGLHQLRLILAHGETEGFAVENRRQVIVGLGGLGASGKEVSRHGAIGDNGFAALVAELEISVVDRVEVANLRARDFGGSHGTRRADLSADRAVFNVLDALDLILVFGAHENRQAGDVVGLGEQNALGLFRSDRESRGADIGDAREHRRNDGVKAHVGHFKLAAHFFCHVLEQVDFKAFELACFAVKEDKRGVSELRSSLRNFESQNEYGYKPCIKRRFQNAETLQSRNQMNSS